MIVRKSISLALFVAVLFTSLPVRPVVARAKRVPPPDTPVRAAHGMVASSDAIASQVGVEILQRGGNAVDAAVAVALALAVTWPSAGNLGGGGFMMIRRPNGGMACIDYRETAPAGASRNMYLDAAGNLVPDASTVGYRASGVPGTIAGLDLALRKYGTMKWRDVVEPAWRLASTGFTVSEALAKHLSDARDLLATFPESRRIFLRDGNFYHAGETFRQPELAGTLERLRENGPREFYQGRTAQLIAGAMKANNGLIGPKDLSDYRAVEREPLHGTYRGYEIVTMPPPSSGGAVLIEMLNMLEHYDLASMGAQSPARYHVMIEAMRRAFADRAEFFGDPDFVKIPVAQLISKKYADQVRRTIDEYRATPSAQIGHGRPSGAESLETTHYTVVDGHGGAVSNTYTLNGSFGSGVTVPGAGFLLNNEMDDFAAKPGSPNMFGLIQGEANAVAPGKRPLSSVTPTFVQKDGRLVLAIGSPGGPTIINVVLEVIINTIDYGMNIQQAINAPRVHHQWLPDRISYEPNGLSQKVIDELRDRGYTFQNKPGNIGDAEGVMIEPATGMLLGASDPRNPNARAAGY